MNFEPQTGGVNARFPVLEETAKSEQPAIGAGRRYWFNSSRLVADAAQKSWSAWHCDSGGHFCLSHGVECKGDFTCEREETGLLSTRVVSVVKIHKKSDEKRKRFSKSVAIRASG